MNNVMCNQLSVLISSHSVTSLLQPIIQIKTQQVFGYEALSRGPSDSPLHAAPVLFETAEKCGLTESLEEVCLEAAAKNWKTHALGSYLFVNMSPSMLIQSHFKEVQLIDLIEINYLNPQKIVIEISERFPALQLNELKVAIAWLKEKGFQIAIDDLGTGYSGLKLWSDLQPDFVKIDRHFIRDIQDDLIKLEFVRSLVSLSKRLGCGLIAEGVETLAELNVVVDLGIDLIQGFLVGRPKPFPTADLRCLLDRRTAIPSVTGNLARNLCNYIEPIKPDMKLKLAMERFEREVEIFSLPVVLDGRPLGLLHKWRVLELFSTKFGRSLNEKRAVINFVGADALVVDQESTLDEVSQRLIEEDYHYIKQHFIVVNQGAYIGLGTTRQLLKQITQDRIEKARYANPLTGLPGNVPINNELERRLKYQKPFEFIYVDINDFKPLNDTLGYQAGDIVITRLAELLVNSFVQLGSFVGHIGGDDFVLMCDTEVSQLTLTTLQNRYQKALESLYSQEIFEQGYFLAKSRDGQEKKFLLSSISIAVIQVKAPEKYSADFIAEKAAESKKASKSATDHINVRTLE